jgi:hypothetical protein
MKRGPQNKQRKKLSAGGLIKTIREMVAKVEDPNSSKRNKIPLSDCLMSAFAMFSLKSASLLAFDRHVKDKVLSHNLRTLYKVSQTPSDTYMRDRLDPIDPKGLRKCFLSVFEDAQSGKLLERYKFLDSYLISVDGTEIFNSERVHCNNCCVKNHRDGRTTYHHQILSGVIVHPDMRQVIPLCPEPITREDGAKKNDCERNASHRFLKDLKREHPKLKATIVSDALSANAPYVNKLKNYGYDFIINVKPKGNKTLFEWVDKIDLETTQITKKNNIYTFRYVNGIPLNDTDDVPEVNFIECQAVELKGRREVKKTFTWITSHTINKNNVFQLMQGARARWKIENETFNTLKNQGYNFEHNFGHGKKNLHTVFAHLMMLAFAVDQIQEAACGLFQKALERLGSRRAFWERLRSFFSLALIKNWVDVFEAMGSDGTGFILNPDTS